MPKVVRETDPLSTGHGCTGVTTLASHAQSPTVYANNLPCAVPGAPTVVHTIGGICVPHVAQLNAGSHNVFTENKPQGRVTDSADAGAMIDGSPNVYAND